MELRRLVRLLARFGDGEVKNGTGYWLTESLVLTARHVVVSSVTGEAAESFEVISTAELSTSPHQGQEICWMGEGSTDAALLRLATDLDPMEPPAYQACVRGERQGFVAHGWIRFEDTPWKTDLPGDAVRFLPSAERLTLVVTAEPEQGQDWSGISGAPLFIGSRLLGVIVQLEPLFEGRKLLAVPAASFCALPQYLRHFADRPRTSELTKLLERAERILEASSEIRALLDENLGATIPDGLANGLRAAIDAGSIPHWLAALRKTQKAFIASPGSEADAVRDLAVLLLPALCFRKVAASVGFGGEELPVYSEPLAEAVLALFEGRHCAFEAPPREVDLPKPRYAIRTPLDPGMDTDGEQAFEDVAKHLRHRLLFNPDAAYEKWLGRRSLTDKLPRGTLSIVRQYPLEEQPAKLVERLNIAFKQHLEDEAPAYYLLMDRETAKDCSTFMARVREEIPALAIALCESDPDRHLQERDDLSQLGRLLYHAENTRG